MQVLDDSQRLLGDTDVFAEEQQARQDQLDALLNKLAPPQELQAQDDGDDADNVSDDAVFAVDHPAAPADLAALQSFLASDAAPQDKIEQLVNFLADGPATEIHDELAADGPAVDVFADEQTQQEQKLKDLVDSLAANKNGNSATALLATDADDVAAANTQNSFLSVIVVLLVAVVLAVATRRSRSKHEKADDENKDFGYSILYE
ncbi:hypothetical protein PR003_g4215 [Phytophthora rubi]|uniref:Uncharacterized protein n=1 Tax=Phytophthora rubi TaxID=129364 RepID=A0A6A3NEH8_9STRA|nr:hypothetical protein PR002_g4267 [Phytophthora rubi]KAE9048284.1 hypothetical protein PR001_g3870 [Phytophthora rubi]KAE9352748.1 hypothetical protein PR003_g4215 [Phytophthora rubi]